MTNSFLFQSAKNKYQMVVYGISLKDAREYVKAWLPNYDMKFICKNPINLSQWILAGVTDKQMKINKINNERFLNGEY